MIPEDFKPHNLRYCFPRVSGDDPASVPGTLLYWGFSPRERG